MFVDMEKFEEFCLSTGNQGFFKRIKNKILVCERLKDKNLRQYTYIDVHGHHEQINATSDLIMSDVLAALLIDSIESRIEKDIKHFRNNLPDILKPIANF